MFTDQNAFEYSLDQAWVREWGYDDKGQVANATVVALGFETK